MAYENSQTFNVESKKMISTGQFESTTRLEVASDKPVKKVVCVNALPKIVSFEKISDTLSFSGRTSYQVVYETEEGRLASAIADVEWKETLSNIMQSNLFISVKAQENTITAFSANEIAVSTLMNVEVYATTSDTISAIEGVSSDYVTNQQTFEYQRVVNTINDTFNEVVEQEINSKIQDILYYTGDVYLKNVIAGIDTVTFEGSINLTLYAQESDRVVTLHKQIDFRQEVASLSVVPNSIIDANAYLSGLKATASVSEIDAKTNIIYAVEIGLNGVVYSKESMSIMQDAFSLKNKINLSSECVLKENFETEGYYVTTEVGGLSIDKQIDEVLILNKAVATITDINLDSQGSILNGGLELSFICQDENIESVMLEGIIPFSVLVPESLNTDKFDIKVKVNSFKLRGQKEVEVGYDLYINYKRYAEEYITFISGIEEIEEREVNEDAINVYVVKENETLFDIAKALCIRPEEIITQNPGAEEGVIEGTRLVIYAPLDINF